MTRSRRWLVALLVSAWVAGVTVKTMRGAAWDREQHRQGAVRAEIMAHEVQVLQDQGWHQDSLGFWTP